MWTGSRAAVRDVTAVVTASGSTFSVTGSMSAKTGRARSYTATFALATNENGLVITSSPSLTPTARSARCSPAVPLETALANGARTRSANARSNSGSSGPSASRPERSAASTRASSSGPIIGLASGRASSGRRLKATLRSAGSRSGRGGSTPSSPLDPGHPVLERVDQRLPRGLDDVLRDADRAPDFLAIGGVEEHACDRAGPFRLVQDPHLEVDQIDVAQPRVRLRQRLPERAIQCVDGAVALGGAHVALAVNPDLDRGLGLNPAVGALLDDRAPGLEREQRLVIARLLAQQQLE